MPASHAVLQDREGRWALCFERLLDQPPERVWSAFNLNCQERFGIAARDATPPPQL